MAGTRRKFQRATLVTLASLVVGISWHGVAVAQKGAAAFDPRSIHDEIAYLASDALQGRDTGEAGNDKAARYIAGIFARAGVKPIGTALQKDAQAPTDGSGYFQPFTFLAGHTAGKNSHIVLNLGGKPLTLKPGVEFLPAGLSGSGKAEGGVVFAGYGIHAPSLGHDDFAGINVKGKVLLILAGSPGDNPHEPLYAYGSLMRKASAANDMGVKGILVVTPKETELKSGRFEFRQNDDAAMPVMRVLPSTADALLGAGALTDLAARAAKGEIVSRDLPASAAIQADVHKITRVTANIVGLIEGSDPVLKSEVVVIGGHMDHLGLGSPYSLARSEAPAVHHGADDNASGATGVLEMAKYFGPRAGAHRTKRSILLICFTGEELGLYGSEYYVKHPIAPLDRTAAMLNMDMIGRLRDKKLTVIGSESAPTFGPLLDEKNRTVGLAIAKSAGDFGGGSDHESFDNQKIPVLFFFTGTHEDYHTPTDTVDKINCDGEAKVLKLVADCAVAIADAPEKPIYHKAEKSTTARGGFGVYFGSVPDYAAQVEGVQLNAVRAGSPAAKAGLQSGDIIIKFGQRTIRNVNDYTYALQDHKPGDVVDVTVKRGGQEVTLKATLAARPQ